MNDSSTKKLRTACTRDCPDACGIIATVEGNRVVRIQGDPEHPITQGFLCKRTSGYLKRQYDPSRITAPMIRRNKHTNREWEKVSLDEALDFVAERMLHYRKTCGPASIMDYRCGGSLGIMKFATSYFFQQFGPVTIKSGDVCAGAGSAAQKKDFGTVDSHDVFDIYNSKTIFVWGKNVYCSQVHLLPILKKAKANGGRIVLIDPIRHRTASLSDEYVEVCPGGDAALAFGIAGWLFENDRYDREAPEYCDHFDTYRGLVESRSTAEWAALASVSTSQLEKLAALYAQGPTSILVGWGMQRRSYGAAAIRAIDALAAISGNLGVAGGGVSFYFPRRAAFNTSFVDSTLAPRTIPEPLLGQGIESARDPRIEMVWISAGNPVAMIPDSGTVRSALMDRFTVVVDCFMTDTAKCADVFLPTTTMLEDDDLIGAYGHHWINEVRPVVSPPEGVHTDYQIIQKLATRVGLEGWFKDNTETWKRRLFVDLESRGYSLNRLRTAPLKNPDANQVLFPDRKFATPSGKVNLICSYDPIPKRTNHNFPLQLMAISTDEAQGSQWLPETQTGAPPLTVNPEMASAFAEGEIVYLVSELDKLKVQLIFDSNQRRDLAIMKKGGWLSAGRCPNILTKAELTDDGEGAVYYETAVRLVSITPGG